jgi:hypothetical protein
VLPTQSYLFGVTQVGSQPPPILGITSEVFIVGKYSLGEKLEKGIIGNDCK